MVATFQVIALSSQDPQGVETTDEPRLSFPDALKTAKELKGQGKAFRVHVQGEGNDAQVAAFQTLGALF